MQRRMGRQKFTAAAALSVARVLYNNSGSTLAECDADSSQAATSLLRPVGVTAESVASGEEVSYVVDGEVSFTAAGAISAGDLLIAADGTGGRVIALNASTINSEFADGDEVYVVGRAFEDAADGTIFPGKFAPYLIQTSEV